MSNKVSFYFGNHFLSAAPFDDGDDFDDEFDDDLEQGGDENNDEQAFTRIDIDE